MPAKQLQHLRKSPPEQLASFRKNPADLNREANAKEARGETELLEFLHINSLEYVLL